MTVLMDEWNECMGAGGAGIMSDGEHEWQDRMGKAGGMARIGGSRARAGRFRRYSGKAGGCAKGAYWRHGGYNSMQSPYRKRGPMGNIGDTATIAAYP